MIDGRALSSMAKARFLRQATPVSLTFELTHLCNLACEYCDRHTKLPGEMTREQILTVLGDFLELGTRQVNLDGGEPLAHKHVDEIVEFLVRRGARVRMNTNGILVPKKLDTIKKLERAKISLDGPRENHNAIRGERAFERAVRGAELIREAGIDVEFTCVVGRHNHEVLGELIDFVEEWGTIVIFQPARNSLFLDPNRDGAAWQLDDRTLRRAFAYIEERKHNGSAALGNRWSSLKHFRNFPDDTPIPCNAGWVQVTMDPEGTLYHCGQIPRAGIGKSVIQLGARRAFDELVRVGCDQCWCARVVEGNYLWGGRVDMMMPPLSPPSDIDYHDRPDDRRHLPVVR